MCVTVSETRLKDCVHNTVSYTNTEIACVTVSETRLKDCVHSSVSYTITEIACVLLYVRPV